MAGSLLTRIASLLVCATGLLIASCGSQGLHPPVVQPIPESCGTAASAQQITYTGVFSAVGNMNVARTSPSLIALPNGGAFVAGSSRTIELYDPMSQSFSVVGQIQGDYGTAVPLRNGCILSIESTTTTRLGVIAEIYNPSARLLSSTGLPVVQQDTPAVVLPNGKVLWCGGASRNSADDMTMVRTDKCQQYDPVSGSFQLAGSLNRAVDSQAAALLTSGKVLYTGGWVFSEQFPNPSGTFAGVYDPASQVETPLPSFMNVGRASHTATTLKDGRVLIVGGTDGSNILSSAEVFDPNTSTFSLVGSMSVARFDHSATLLTDGRVLIAGGFNLGVPLDTAEIFDPSTNSFGTTFQMTQARARADAVVLENGQVLIAGGTTAINNGPALSSAEMFH